MMISNTFPSIYYVPDTVLNTFDLLIHIFLITRLWGGVVIISTSQMEKLNHGEINFLAQGQSYSIVELEFHCT